MSVDMAQVTNRELRDLWQYQLANEGWPVGIGAPRWPLQYTGLRKNAPLFIGLNPSYNEKDDPVLLVREPARNDLESEARVAEVYEREARSKGQNGGKLHPYFGRFGEMVGDLGWNHVDLFSVRHTSQKELKGALGIDDSGAIWNPFARRQLDVALKLSAALRPPVVTVVNALASTISWGRIKNELTWDEENGFDIRKSNGSTTPWIFSGMLTGQRALDVHSRRRLEWHVRRAIAWSLKGA